MAKIDGSKMATKAKNAFQKVPKIAKWPNLTDEKWPKAKYRQKYGPRK